MAILVAELWLLPCTVSAGMYAAMIEAVPEAEGAVKVAVHEALPVELWTSVHGEPVKVPETPESESVTIPVGTVGFELMSVTVAEQLEASLTVTVVGVQLTVVVVV